MEGSLSRTVSRVRNSIIQILSRIEARIEFPEEELRISPKSIIKSISKITESLQKLIASHDLGKILSEGLSLVITGRANVGKSTLFNALLEKDRAIVTPYPGTTRDYLQEKIKINDALFTLTDTAGINTTTHPVAKEGIKRGKKLAAAGDGILLLLDASCQETPEDLKSIKKCSGKKTILVFNKIDLPVKMDLKKIKKSVRNIPALEISALKGTNMDRLKATIYESFVSGHQESADIVFHLRQKLLLEDIMTCLVHARRLLEEGYSEEVYAEEIRKTLPFIGELTGEIRREDIIEEIFSRFCVGK
jgi:tRNA modification GTPase